jgi:3-hydroxyacyl-CoA dehydrogenase
VKAIERVAVLGAGVMGSGIAAHLANAGVSVTLLDMVPEGAVERDTLAAVALERMLKADPAPFMHPRNARRIAVGNLEDDLGRLVDADWIVEAVVERLDVKRALYERVDAVRAAGSIVSSNTSTIPLGALTEGLSDALQQDFLITHFFNPPRYMRLLEVVAGPRTRAEALAAIEAFGDRELGKGVVHCKDTPGFIGNRIGIYWMQCAVVEAMRMGIGVEEADAVVGRPMGIPRTGVFGLLDLVGIDLMPHVLASMRSTLDAHDAFREYEATPALIERMIADGYTGRKGKGGFYRLERSGGERVKQVIDLADGSYHPARRPRPDCVEAARSGGLRALVEHPDPTGAYAWRVLSRTLTYAASLVPEIADDVAAVDAAMRLGYNWTYGPFELADRLGTGWLAERLADDGVEVPELLRTAAGRPFYQVEAGSLAHLAVDGDYRRVQRAPGVLLLGDVRRAGEPLEGNAAASLWDLGDGVLCLEFHTKMNAIDPQILSMVRTAIDAVSHGRRALILHNDGENFSVGVNLGMALFAANIAAWDEIEGLVREGQETYGALKRAPFPVVGAPTGMALGGGCEILLHCDALVAHAETYMGLVEVGVGLIPAWGGCKELLARCAAVPGRPGGPMPPVTRVFETIGMARVARSAAQARELGLLRPGDRIVMNRDRVLAEGKALALELAAGYEPPPAIELRLPGPSGRASLDLAVQGLRAAGKATAHDVIVAGALAQVLTGGAADITEPVGEQALLDLERGAFMSLVRTPETIARVEHMLETGKPLRN